MSGYERPDRGISTLSKGWTVGVRLRAGLGVVLLVGFFVLVLGIVGLFLFLGVYGLTTGHVLGGVKLAIIAGVVVIAIGTALRKVLSTKTEPHGARVDRTDQPELRRMIDELAVAANTRGPDEVWIVPDVNAAVWEESKLLGLRSGRRYMMIGLPLLGGLSVSELRSVLGHELGHYSRGHTKLSAVTYRATATMERTLAELNGYLRVALSWYVRLYLLVARSANRAQELQADQAAVRAAGKVATRSALGKINALDAAWKHYGSSYVSLVRPAGRTPELLMGFHEFLSDDLRRAQMTEAQASLLDAEPSSRYDSHPPMRVRIAAIDALTESEQLNDDRPGWSVLREPKLSIPRLEGQLVADGLGPRASWAEIVRLGTAHVAEHNAKVLSESTMKKGFTRTGALTEILDVMERGEVQRMVDALGTQMPVGERMHVFTRLLADSVSTALIEAGQAQFELDWSDTWRLRLANGELVDMAERVAPAIADPAQVRSLRDWMTARPTA